MATNKGMKAYYKKPQYKRDWTKSSGYLGNNWSEFGFDRGKLVANLLHIYGTETVKRAKKIAKKIDNPKTPHKLWQSLTLRNTSVNVKVGLDYKNRHDPKWFIGNFWNAKNNGPWFKEGYKTKSSTINKVVAGGDFYNRAKEEVLRDNNFKNEVVEMMAGLNFYFVSNALEVIYTKAINDRLGSSIEKQRVSMAFTAYRGAIPWKGFWRK